MNMGNEKDFESGIRSKKNMVMIFICKRSTLTRWLCKFLCKPRCQFDA